MTLTLDLQPFKAHCLLFDRRYSVSEVRDILDQKEKRCALDMDFSYNSAMTFIFDLELGSRALHNLY